MRGIENLIARRKPCRLEQFLVVAYGMPRARASVQEAAFPIFSAIEAPSVAFNTQLRVL